MDKISRDRRGVIPAPLAMSDYKPVWSGADSQEFSLNTGLDVDYACFALWHHALSKEDEIIRDLADTFEVIGDFRVNWSKEHYNRNIARLYERNAGLNEFRGWDSKIGLTPFRFVIVRDSEPRYTWKRSVSGAIEPSNERMVAAKYRYRALFEKKYQVHSSNNLSELLFQAALVLGVERAQQVLAATECIREDLHKDLEGADGWDSWEHLLSVLNMGCKYLVLRNFEGLPKVLEDSDIDFLCDNFQRLASGANVRQISDRPFKGKIFVGEERVSVDIRYIGDGYYPACWQLDMLRHRVSKDGFFVPAPDDLFFSLLYHCKIQKPKVKPKYGPELAALAAQLRFDWFQASDLEDDVKSAGILAGYMRSRGFCYEQPVDTGVYANQAIINQLPKRFQMPGFWKRRYRSAKNKAKKALRQPEKITPYILNKLGMSGAK